MTMPKKQKQTKVRDRRPAAPAVRPKVFAKSWIKASRGRKT